MPGKKKQSPKRGHFEAIYARTGRKKRRLGCFRMLFRLFLLLMTSLGIAAGLIGTIYYKNAALRFDMDDLKEVPQRTLVYDKQGNICLLYTSDAADEV